MDDLADITITADSPDWLAEFTRRLVEDGLIACGNIVPQIRSIYAWEDKIQDDQESLVILHTRKSLVTQIIERTSQEHPYDTPQILVLPVIDANPDYRTWVLDTTAKASASLPDMADGR